MLSQIDPKDIKTPLGRSVFAVLKDIIINESSENPKKLILKLKRECT